MRSTFTSICVGSLLVQILSSAAFAQTYSAGDRSAKRPFVLHAERSDLPKAEVIIGEDGARIPRRLKINPALTEQINQARAQTHGTIAPHYIVPGHMAAGL